MDVPGTLLSCAGLGTFVYAIIEAPSRGWSHAGTLASFVIAVVLIGIFFGWERRSDHPMFDPRFLRSARFSAAAAAIMFTFFALLGLLFVFTQLLQFYFGYSPLEAGLRT